MPQTTKEILSLELPCDPQAPGVVRDALHKLDWLGWVLGDLTLIASELVANAVTHSAARPQDTLTVRADLASDHLRIAVQDPGLSGREAHVRDDGGMANGGWGLLIVQQLSMRWGSERGDGHWVWADVALQAPASVSSGDVPEWRSDGWGRADDGSRRTAPRADDGSRRTVPRPDGRAPTGPRR